MTTLHALDKVFHLLPQSTQWMIRLVLFCFYQAKEFEIRDGIVIFRNIKFNYVKDTNDYFYFQTLLADIFQYLLYTLPINKKVCVLRMSAPYYSEISIDIRTLMYNNQFDYHHAELLKKQFLDHCNKPQYYYNVDIEFYRLLIGDDFSFERLLGSVWYFIPDAGSISIESDVWFESFCGNSVDIQALVDKNTRTQKLIDAVVHLLWEYIEPQLPHFQSVIIAFLRGYQNALMWSLMLDVFVLGESDILL